MIESAKIRNFGPLEAIDWPELGPINIIIGKNSTGKTFLLKAIYCAVKSLEAYGRGNDVRTLSDILVEKLYWTFETEKIGNLVRKGADSPLHFEMSVDQRKLHFGFGADTVRQVTQIENHVRARSANSIFLPAKEVLTAHKIILQSRETDRIFGFDDTYRDLVLALLQATTKGKNFTSFAQSRSKLSGMLGGKIEYDEAAGSWTFKKGNQRFALGVTAEGIKKISILDRLLGNRYLNSESIIFIDEPESALHPSAISSLMEIIFALSGEGIQFFLATHSYFVMKKLALLSQAHATSMPVLSAEGANWKVANLLDGMPDNEIIAESVSLYRQQVEAAI